jgi:hypothetical protein
MRQSHTHTMFFELLTGHRAFSSLHPFINDFGRISDITQAYSNCTANFHLYVGVTFESQFAPDCPYQDFYGFLCLTNTLL